MPDREMVATHYAHNTLLEGIEAGLQELGLSRDTVSVEDLGPVDEFHIGGRVATERFLKDIALAENDHVLDIGCGLGGASRFAAMHFNCNVAGIDLTDEYIRAGRELCDWVGLRQRIRLEQGDATKMPFVDNEFDKAYMLHVGMNIADKANLFSEIGRVLKPGGTLGVYDIMQVGPTELNYPVPWSTTAAGSALGTPDEYRQALEAAGFTVIAEQNRRDFALDYYAEMQSKVAAAGRSPSLGLHIVMGEEAPTKLGNMIRGISHGPIAPVEIIAKSVK